MAFEKRLWKNILEGVGSLLCIFPPPPRDKNLKLNKNFSPATSIEEAWAKDKEALRRDRDKVFGKPRPLQK